MNNQEFIVKSLGTIHEMLTDRGVDVSNIDKVGLAVIVDANQNKPSLDIVMNNVKILYYLSNKFKWSELKKLFDDDENLSKYELVILVTKEKVSQNNLKLIHGLGLPLNIFEIKELQFNISKHVLVPKHEVIRDEEEVKNIIAKYCLKSRHQLPHILKTDPMSRYLGLKSGDIVKITRNSPTSGEYIVYRCCL